MEFTQNLMIQKLELDGVVFSNGPKTIL